MDWNKMPNLKELTLVVPTYNRQQCALRQMKFWSNSPVAMYVLDGTSAPINDELLKDLTRNVHYYHMPCSYEERVGKAAEVVDTQFVSFLCDDEFFIPSALEKCMGFLKNNKDFVACIGRCLGFYTVERRTLAKLMHKEPNGNGHYAVQRAEAWKRSTAIISKNNFMFHCPYVQEIQFELATDYQGKSMVIEELMWLRNLENDAIDCDKWDRKLSLYEWINNPRYGTDVKIFYETTATELAKINGADKEQVLADLKLVTNSYWVRWGANSTKDLLRNRLLDLIPKKSKRALEQMNVSCRWKQIINEAEKIQENGITVDIMQLNEIVKYMEKMTRGT